ncbi:MAG: nucleotidyltransferase [Gammaproteobacteria bacterium]|nr:nucleotidyltransferase [Gammaproteobacteria bacterium]
MAIPETQLQTWSHQGAVAQSRDTYATMRRALLSDQTAYHGTDFKVFLQGSYGNDTNVYAESDVDVVICLRSTFHYDIDLLTPGERVSFENAYPGGASYHYPQFKADVQHALESAFPRAVTLGSKAFKIAGSGSRRSADVVAATQFRCYRRFAAAWDCEYDEGIRLVSSNGVSIVNCPRQHSENCTAKHQEVNGLYKPVVRIYKNMRNTLVRRRIISRQRAPSYFLEGLLHNVPSGHFGGNYCDNIVRTFNWMYGADRSQFMCANGIRPLFGNTADTWSAVDCDTFLDALSRLWNDGL